MKYRISAFSFSLILFIFSLAPTAFADNVSSFVFITEPQTIGVGEMSKEITLQAQNAGGTSEQISETFDLSFSSNSGTGEFLGSTGKAVTKTMSTGSANRTFYYKDANSGDFTLTVTATGRTSLRTFSASQHIFVGTSGGGQTETASTTENSTQTQTQSTSSSSSSNSTSAHSSPASLSNAENKMEFEISAGRDRLSSVGTTLAFQVSPAKLQNISEQSISYQWSFGDGTVGLGKTANHAYRFAGEYAVVVNAAATDKQAVSRLKVKVISPEISLSRVSGGVEVVNKSSAEINLEGWSLVSPPKAFVFPKDTLISADKKIIFADEVTGISSEALQLVNPLNKIFSEISTIQNVSNLGSTQPMSLEEIQAKVEEVKNKLAQVPSQPAAFLAATPVSPVSAPQQKQIVATSTTDSQLANVVTVFEAQPEKGIVSSIFSWPSRGFNFIKHLFVED